MPHSFRTRNWFSYCMENSAIYVNKSIFYNLLNRILNYVLWFRLSWGILLKSYINRILNFDMATNQWSKDGIIWNCTDFSAQTKLALHHFLQWGNRHPSTSHFTDYRLNFRIFRYKHLESEPSSFPWGHCPIIFWGK